jgi:hypothetical protein
VPLSSVSRAVSSLTTLCVRSSLSSLASTKSTSPLRSTWFRSQFPTWSRVQFSCRVRLERAAARLRHTVGTGWATRRYLDMSKLREMTRINEPALAASAG